jgi:hypothetical protein
MDAGKWFKGFIEYYRKIVDSKYADRKETFPFYPPIDVAVYVVDDPKNIFPQIVAFFETGIDEEWPASNIVTVNQTKIEWENDPNELEEMDRDTAIEVKWHENFYEEIKHPGLITRESFKLTTLESNPSDLAMIYVQKHLIHEQQKERYESFLKLSVLRKGIMGTERLKELRSKLSGIQSMKDVEKADVLCQVFWIMGFEAINLERLKDIPQYKDLNSQPHVDVIAVLLSEKILVAIEEGELNKERWYKLYCLPKTLETVGFLGKKEDWAVSHVAIGRKSKGVDYLEGNVQVISADYFGKIFEDFVNTQKWAPSLSAIRRILGYDLDFFKIKA